MFCIVAKQWIRNFNCERAHLTELPASKLSYLGEWNESRENARASSEAARGRGKEKIYERSLQALLSSARRSRVLARLASLTQIGELARRLHTELKIVHTNGNKVRVE